LKKALDLRRLILALEGESPRVLAGLCSALNRTAEVLVEIGNRDEAILDYQEAERYGRKMLSLYGESHSSLSYLISSLSGLSDLADFAGDKAGSTKHQEAASQLTARLPYLGGD
jgi:hypothetical protein